MKEPTPDQVYAASRVNVAVRVLQHMESRWNCDTAAAPGEAERVYRSALEILTNYLTGEIGAPPEAEKAEEENK